MAGVVQQPHESTHVFTDDSSPCCECAAATHGKKRIGGLKHTPEYRSLRAVLAPGVVFGIYEPTKSSRVCRLQLLRRGLPGSRKSETVLTRAMRCGAVAPLQRLRPFDVIAIIGLKYGYKGFFANAPQTSASIPTSANVPALQDPLIRSQ